MHAFSGRYKQGVHKQSLKDGRKIKVEGHLSAAVPLEKLERGKNQSESSLVIAFLLP